ncbi:hypothetical protein KQY44_002522 [Listeria monocytogenes]|nr:hypothetical protein [Listeria monocytogenes]
MDKVRKGEFRTWLENKGTMGKHPIADALSRCKRLESSLQIDLDREFLNDQGERLISVFEYSTEDEKNNRQPPKGIQFESGSNIKNGMASLRSAGKKYFEFCSSN